MAGILARRVHTGVGISKIYMVFIWEIVYAGFYMYAQLLWDLRTHHEQLFLCRWYFLTEFLWTDLTFTYDQDWLDPDLIALLVYGIIKIPEAI